MIEWPTSQRQERTSFGGLDRSTLMARVRSSGNSTTELRLASLLRKNKLVGWRRNYSLVGKPDFVFRREKIALFVDGCFWHGHGCGRNLTPKTNRTSWKNKITDNKDRDRRNNRALRNLGWTTIRVWECSLVKKQASEIGRIRRAFERKLGAPA